MSQRRPAESAVRLAAATDAGVAAQLLYDFNREFDSPTPDPPQLAERVRELIEGGDTAVLLGALDGSDRSEGVAVLRFRAALWSAGLECYLAELYVVPERRGQGLGRTLMTAGIGLARARGADTMDLGTGEDDVGARALYESLGFTHREGGADGPVNYCYVLDLNG